MIQYALLLIILGAFISLCCIVILMRHKKVGKRKEKITKNFTADDDNDLSGISETEDKELLNDGKIDERFFEISDSEAERPLINAEDREYYQSLSENQKKQDEAVELLLRAAQENEQNADENKHFDLNRQEQKKQNEKHQKNNRQLKKILNFKLRKKVAKKVAKEDIQLDDKKIKMIKLKALNGRIK